MVKIEIKSINYLEQSLVSNASLAQQQGFYRYNPIDLKNAGPARIFPHTGEEGTLYYVLTTTRRNLLLQGQVSQPLSLTLQQLEAAIDFLGERWDQTGTLLADLHVFQSGWLNFNVPPGEQFSSDYVRERREVLIYTLLSQVKNLLSPPATNASPGEQTRHQRIEFYQLIEKFGQARPVISAIHERDSGLSDREFARQRLAGPNPMVLRRLQQREREILQSWSHDQSYHLPASETVHLVEAANQNRLFIADYPLFESLIPADLHIDRYVGSPQAVFCRSEQNFYPLLIQLEAGGKIFTPQTADEWMRAKLYVQVADTTHQELIAHLCYTHLAMEAFAIATPRQLPQSHPLYQLLAPHFQFLLAINTRGNRLLLGESGAVEKLLAPTLKTSLDLINQAYRDRPFEDYSLPHNMTRRGLTPEYLPEFPYRDDAQLLWDAIANYVTTYLQRYYQDDQAIHQDGYLQAWAAELGAPLNTRPISEFPQLPPWLPEELATQTGLKIEELPPHPRVPDFPTAQAPGQITSLQQLIDVATQIIFTCGPQHAAVNLSQFDYMGYAPNSPFAAYARPDAAVAIDQILPPKEQDLEQMQLAFALANIRWGQLGDSKLIRFSDVRDRQTLQQFQTQLKEIESEIQQRNQQRSRQDGVDYSYLLPSQITNSINI
jgi:arachidonate 15-lipoxygenase